MDGFVASKASLGSMRPAKWGKGGKTPKKLLMLGVGTWYLTVCLKFLVDLLDLSSMERI